MVTTSLEQELPISSLEPAIKKLQRRVDAEALIFMGSLNALFIPMLFFYHYEYVPFAAGAAVLDSLLWNRDSKRLNELKALDTPTSAAVDQPEPPHTQ